MRLLTLDIETSPNLADVWGLWQQNVSLSQLRQSTRMLCFAAKWHGDKRVIFHSEHHGDWQDRRSIMVNAAWNLLNEAEGIIHFNGKRFDTPHLNREFVEAGLTPPSPYKQIDLCEVVKRVFKFPSNKLEYVSKQLGLKGKLQHTGHKLWVDCMAGDDKAWNLMRRYNKRDVVTTEELYDRLLPGIPASMHPHVGLYHKLPRSTWPGCGSVDIKKDGFAYTSLSRFQRYECKACGTWSRGGKRLGGVDTRGVSA